MTLALLKASPMATIEWQGPPTAEPLDAATTARLFRAAIFKETGRWPQSL